MTLTRIALYCSSVTWDSNLEDTLTKALYSDRNMSIYPLATLNVQECGGSKEDSRRSDHNAG